MFSAGPASTLRGITLLTVISTWLLAPRYFQGLRCCIRVETRGCKASPQHASFLGHERWVHPSVLPRMPCRGTWTSSRSESWGDPREVQQGQVQGLAYALGQPLVSVQVDLLQPPCHEQGHLQPDQVAQSPVQPGLECFQGWGIDHLSGQPLPGFHHPCHKEFLPSI